LPQRFFGRVALPPAFLLPKFLSPGMAASLGRPWPPRVPLGHPGLRDTRASCPSHLGSCPAKCRSNFIARDGVYAENAGAIFGGCLDGRNPKKMKGRSFGYPEYARDAEATFGHSPA